MAKRLGSTWKSFFGEVPEILLTFTSLPDSRVIFVMPLAFIEWPGHQAEAPIGSANWRKSNLSSRKHKRSPKRNFWKRTHDHRLHGHVSYIMSMYMLSGLKTSFWWVQVVNPTNKSTKRLSKPLNRMGTTKLCLHERS